MIESPYVIASRIAFLRSFVRLRKKLTVIGIIGHTQGVSKAINPPRKPAKKMNNQDVSVAETVVSPNAFNWSMTGVQRAASSVNSLEVRTGLFSALSLLVTGAGTFSSATSSTTFSVSGCTAVTSSCSTSGFSTTVSAAAVIFIFFLSNEKPTRSGGRQVSSLQAINSTSPSALNLAGSVTLNFWVNETVPGYQRRFMANSSSYTVVGLTDEVGLPISSAPFSVSNVNEVETGPPSGKSWSYKCQPLSAVAVKTISFSAEPESFSCIFHFTGWRICACTVSATSTNIKVLKSFFILFLLFLLFS